MPEQHLFEYAVVRVVPRVEREEFLNVGVILYCRDKKFLRSVIHMSESRFDAFPGTDLAFIKKHLSAFTRICEGEPGCGPIALLDIASRFRWLTGTRSTVIQTSKVHPGLCYDPAEKLETLVNELVNTAG